MSVNILPRSSPKKPLDHEPQAITWARQAAGMSKRDLACAIGCSESLIGEIERGTRNATPARLKQIADALNCPVVILQRKQGA